MSFGTPKSGQAQKKTNWFKLKEGDSVFRILPPHGSQANSGKWATYNSLHFGYRTTDGKMVTFQSTLEENYDSGMIEVPDAALERADKLKAARDLAEQSGDEAKAKFLSEKVRAFNLDKKWYMNVVDLNGNVGVLTIPHKMKQALDIEIKKLEPVSGHPASMDNGRYFVFTRIGTGRNTSHSVRVYKQKRVIDGVGEVEVDMPHKIDASWGVKIEENGIDLGKISMRVTPEEIEQIVKTTDIKTDISTALDAIVLKYRGPKKSYGNQNTATTPAAATATSALDQESDVPDFTYEEPVAPTPPAAQAPAKKAARPLPPQSEDALFKELGI